MPTLQLPTDVETAPPGALKRRTWTAPVVRSHSLILLTFRKLYLAPPTVNYTVEAVDKIENTLDLDAAFGPMATVLDLESVRSVRLDLLKNALILGYEMRGAASRLRIDFATYETADELYTKIWRRLGPRFQLRSRGLSKWDAVRVPVAFIGAILLATLALSLLANWLSDNGAASSELLRPFARADWRWICGAGGAILAPFQIWLYRTLTKPPNALILAPRD